MSRTISALLCAAVLFQPVECVAYADEPAVAPVPTAVGQACADRYIAALHMEKTTKATTDAMMKPLMEMLKRPGETTEESQAQAAVMDVMEEVSEELMPKIIADMKPALTNIFTDAEICTMADFYETPAGQSIIAKMPAFSGEIAKSTAKYLPDMQRRIFERICEKVSCKGTQLERLIAS